MKRAVKIGISVLLSLVLIISAVVFVFRITESTEEVVELPPIGENGEELTPGAAHELPSHMIFRSAVAMADETGSSVTLTATVTPVNATNKALDWSAEFVNPTSAWATGKDVNDYLTVIETGATTALVTCEAPFGEQVKITVTSQDNPEAKAECVVDYAKRITDLTVSLHKGSSTGTVVTTASGSSALSIPFNDTAWLYMTIEPTYSVGTLADTFSYGSVKATPDSALDVVVTTVNEFGNNDLFPESKTYANANDISFRGGYEFVHEFIPMDYEDSQGVHHTVSVSSRNALYNGVALLVNSNTLATFDFTATGTYSTYQKSVGIYYSENSLMFSVESVSINDSTLVF